MTDLVCDYHMTGIAHVAIATAQDANVYGSISDYNDNFCQVRFCLAYLSLLRLLSIKND